MRALLAGVDRFQREVFPQKQGRFEELNQGQSPETLFITCADSRIVPNLVTSTEPGELFVLRNAGNLVRPYSPGSGEAATIEYAVQALKVKDIVLCGHSKCGAMAALLDPQSCASLPAVEAWIQPARQMMKQLRQRHEGRSDEELLQLAIQENVAVQLENLLTHPSVSEAVESGALNLHGWVYSIGTGSIDVLDRQQGTFVSLGSEQRTA